ncbi:MAG TPA: host-nuclease inhibitor Gam family protein [Planctomycetaceae bacterium]|nr:host-nuclease inhibitor Gam family protein [Planctomycetaceae bacterium]
MSSKTRPPGETLAFEPQIASQADLCSAMAELAWIDTRQAELEAECDRQVEAIKSRYQGLMRLAVEGRWDVSFADRQAVLSQAIETYCNEHQSELVKGKGRSREFTHGTVSWKKTPEGVKVVEGRTKDDLTEEFIDQHSLRPRLHELLESITVDGQPGAKDHRTAADFFDIALELSLTRAKLEYKAGRLTQAQLELVGLTWDKGADKFTFKAAKQVVRTEANLSEVA